MPKLKITDFKGLATDYDQDDINPSYVVESLNLKNKRGYMGTDTLALTKLSKTTNTNGIPSGSTTLPNPSNYYNYINATIATTSVSKATMVGPSTAVEGKWEFSFLRKDTSTFEIIFMSSTNLVTSTSGYSLQINGAGDVIFGHYAGTGIFVTIDYLKDVNNANLNIAGADRTITIKVVRKYNGYVYISYSDTDSNYGIYSDKPTAVYSLSSYAIWASSVVTGNKLISHYTPLTSIKATDWSGSSNVTTVVPTPLSWNWEKHIYALITDDKLANGSNIVLSSTEVLLLVAKAYESNVGYHRQIWFKENPNGTWYEVGTEGSYTPTNGFKSYNMPIKNSSFVTDVAEEVILQNVDGTIKIFLPHQCYWFGKIKRDYWPTTGQDLGSAAGTKLSYEGYYFDNLSESVDMQSLNIELYNNSIFCDSSRRLGVNVTLEIDETANTAISKIKYTAKMPTSFSGYDNTLYTLRGRYITLTDDNGEGSPNDVRPPYPGNFYLTPVPTTAQMAAYERYNAGSYTGEYLLSAFSIIAGDQSQSFSEVYNNPNTAWGIDDSATGGVNLSKLYAKPTINPALNTLSGSWYGVSKADIESVAGWEASGPLTISELGFVKGNKNGYIITTAVLDEKTEIIVDSQRLDTSGITANRFAIKISIELPIDINRRVTRLKTYVKFDNAQSSDFELANSYNLLGVEKPEFIDFYLSEYSLQGTTLSQNIGFFLEEKNQRLYKPITGINRIAIESGIALITRPGDSVNVFYNVVGGGNLQSDLFYESNILREISTTNITGLTKGNGFFLLFTPSYTHVIKASEISGVLAFSSVTTLSEGAVDKTILSSSNPLRDFVITTHNGAIHISYNGVYMTNGYKNTLISDIVTNNFRGSTSLHSMYYNDLDHTIYIIMYDDSIVWRYRVIDQSWEHLGMGTIMGTTTDNIKNIIADLDGNLTYLTDSYLYISGGSPILIGNMVSNTITLAEPGAEKKIKKLDIDYIGSCVFTVYLDNDLTPAGSFLLDTLTKRDIASLDILLANNHPFRKFRYEITQTSQTFKLYSLSIIYDGLWEGSLGDATQGLYT